MKNIFLIISIVTILFGCNSQKYKVYDSSLEEIPAWVKNRSNIDESKANIYKRLDVLKTPSGESIETPLQWIKVSQQVKDYYGDFVYGKPLPRPQKLTFELIETGKAEDLKAIRKQYKIVSTNNGKSFSFNVIVYIPENATKVPVIVSPNFSGNHTIWADKDIILPKHPLRNNERVRIKDNKAHDYQRGNDSVRHPFDKILSRGYAFATFCYNEVFPDNPKGASDSVYQIYPQRKKSTSIPAWAWANSRVLDLLETMPEIDTKKASVAGHSRLGKTAIYTGVFDCRFAIVYSNNSGCLGAATNRRDFGETAHYMARTPSFNHWFVDELKNLTHDNIDELMPFDQSYLLACIAPRGLYVTSATKDVWADPVGEFQSFKDAGKIYNLYGAKNLPSETDNLYIEKPFVGDIGYHLRVGVHGIFEYDWQCFMNYADKIFKRNQ